MLIPNLQSPLTALGKPRLIGTIRLSNDVSLVGTTTLVHRLQRRANQTTTRLSLVVYLGLIIARSDTSTRRVVYK